ncbi:MAG: ATP-binding protein [Spirochaetota bacterium]|nr:ATP-binding protein [Spirochaetota bacterium]
MDIINIFFLSLTAALGLSVLLSLTITRPIHKLQHEAEQVLDDNGAVKEAFSKLRRRDEIGSLSRSLNILSGRLVKRIDFIDSFYSDILHELKNPLTAVRSAAEIMESDSPDWQRPFLITIQEETSRINRILGELRELTRIDTQLDVEENEPIDISPFVMELIDGYGRLHRENLRIAAGWMDDRCLVEANPARLRQVLVNLFDNALSFSKSAAHSPALIQVEVLRRGKSEKGRARYAEIIIEDNGPGISPGNLDRIFDRFFTDREDRDDHSGLGLSICKAIVEGYGGTITAGNRDDGGARFAIAMKLIK